MDLVVNEVTYNGVKAISMQGTSGETVVFYPDVGSLIVFVGNGGTASEFSANTDASGKLTELPTATRDEYTFVGWFTAESGGTQVTTDTVFTEDTLLYAQWHKNVFVITVTGRGASRVCYIQFPDGTKVYTAGTYEIVCGASILCSTYNQVDPDSSKITLNGVSVGTGSASQGDPLVYTYYPSANATIDLAYTFNSYDAVKKTSITITEG